MGIWRDIKRAYYDSGGNPYAWFNEQTPNIHLYLQGFAGAFLFFSLFLWNRYGWDATLHNVLGWAEKGVGLHFSTITMTCMMYLFLSIYAEKKGITAWNNVCFAFFNCFGAMMLFEWPYIILYDIIHNKALSGGFFYICTYGLIGENCPRLYNVIFQNGVWALGPLLAWFSIKPYYPRIKLNKWHLILFLILVGSWLFWIFYPFPTQIAYSEMYHSYKGGGLFPQNVYVWYDPTTHELMDQVVFHDLGVFATNMIVKGLTIIFYISLFMFKLPLEEK